MKRYFQGIFGLVRAYQHRFLRDKTAMFFTFLFPLIFLFVFGSIFNSTDVSFRIAILNKADNEFATAFVKQIENDKTFIVEQTVSNFEEAKKRLSRGEIDSVIELPADFGQASATSPVPSGEMIVYYQRGSEQSGQTLTAVMQQVLDSINKQNGRPDAALAVVSKPTESTGLTQFDYTFSGLLGFSILSMSIFGLANAMPAEKQKGSFRRLRASPFRASQLIFANGTHYLKITLLSVLAMVAVALTVFDFNMRGNWLLFGVFAAFSTIMMIGFGLLIGGWAKNESQAAPVSNLVSFPMMFLSGTFFPRFLFPEWLQNITNFLPLTPVVDGFRRIMTENASLVALGPELAIIGVWTVVVYSLAIRLFRWE